MTTRELFFLLSLEIDDNPPKEQLFEASRDEFLKKMLKSKPPWWDKVPLDNNLANEVHGKFIGIIVRNAVALSHDPDNPDCRACENATEILDDMKKILEEYMGIGFPRVTIVSLPGLKGGIARIVNSILRPKLSDEGRGAFSTLEDPSEHDLVVIYESINKDRITLN